MRSTDIDNLVSRKYWVGWWRVLPWIENGQHVVGVLVSRIPSLQECFNLTFIINTLISFDICLAAIVFCCCHMPDQIIVTWKLPKKKVFLGLSPKMGGQGLQSQKRKRAHLPEVFALLQQWYCVVFTPAKTLMISLMVFCLKNIVISSRENNVWRPKDH